MMALTIDNPQVESYFSNSIDKLKEFLETFVKDENELFMQKNMSKIHFCHAKQSLPAKGVARD